MSRKPTAPPGDELVERLRRALDILGLKHTLAQLDEHLAWATGEKPSYSALLEHILGEEANTRLAQRIERRIEACGLRERKTLEAFDFDFQPELDRALILELARLDFVRRKEDLLFTGDSGTGKSHIFQAIALKACEQGLSVRYARGVDLLDDLYAGLADGTYRQRLKRWGRPELLVIDDVGLGQVRKRDDEPTAAHTLFTLIDHRHGRASTAITSNIPLGAWGRARGRPALRPGAQLVPDAWRMRSPSARRKGGRASPRKRRAARSRQRPW